LRLLYRFPRLSRSPFRCQHFFQTLPKTRPVERFVPFVGEINDFSRTCCRNEKGQRIPENTFLHHNIVRLATLTAEREIDKSGPGRFGLSHQTTAGAQIDSGNSSFFNGSGDQSDRLMIERSGRDEKYGIGILPLEHLDYPGNGLRLQGRPLVQSPHPEGDGLRGQTPDNPFLL
jgi:hypothetical protein